MKERPGRQRRHWQPRDIEETRHDLAGLPEAEAQSTANPRHRGTSAAVLSGVGEALERLRDRRAAGPKGESAPDAVRSAVEAATGLGLSQVRLHHDPEAQAITQALDARAVTVGTDVLLGAGAPDVSSPAGWSLLAHEMAHAAQASTGPADAPVALGGRRAPAELQASNIAEAAMTASMGIRLPSPVSVAMEGGLVARRDDPPAPELGDILAFLAAMQNGVDPGPIRRQTASDGEVITWGAMVFRTFEELSAVFRQMNSGVTARMRDVTLTGDAATRAQEFLELSSAWATQFALTPAERVGAGSEVLLGQMRADWLEVNRQIDRTQRSAAVREFRAIRADLEAHAAEVQRGEEQAREALRAAFMSGDSSAVESAASTLGAIIDTGLAIDELSRDFGDAISDLGGPTMPAAGRYVRVLQHLNNVIAAVQLIYVATRGEQPTELRTAVTRISDLGTAFSAGGTLLGLAPHISLYSNLYLGPMLQVIGTQLVQLGELLHRQNRDIVEFNPDLARWGVEPGGRPMYDYMSRVMQAESQSELRDPAADVAEYFFNQRDGLEAATGAAVPIQGIYGFRTLDLPSFKRWLFTNRDRVWSALYGSWRPPERRGGTVRRRSTTSAADPAMGMDALSAMLAAEPSDGTAPAADVRRAVEDASGRSLAGVRVYSGDGVTRIAAALGAEAFTVGDRVFLPSSTPAATSEEGWSLLAHELAHATQDDSSVPLQLGDRGAPAERGADRIATEAAAQADRRRLMPDDLVSAAERSVGTDLGPVGVTEGPRAEATAGQVVLPRGVLASRAADDRFIVLHEIAHVAQMRSTAAPTLDVAAAERDADVAADAMLAGRPHRVGRASPGAYGFGATARRTRDGTMRRSDICHEGQTHEAAQRAGYGADDAAMMYSGNWQRDMNQLVVPILIPAVARVHPPEQVFALLDVLHAVHFGRSMSEQAGSAGAARTEFGTYDPVEHIDNPGGLTGDEVYHQSGDRAGNQRLAGGAGEAFANADPRYAAARDRASLERRDGERRVNQYDRSGLPVYVLASRDQLIEQLHEGVQARRGQDPERGLRLYGEALHVMQDYYAHSNFVEAAINILIDTDRASLGLDTVTTPVHHLDTYVHARSGEQVDRDQNLRTQGGREVLATGTFNMRDTLLSLKEKWNAMLAAPPSRPLHEGVDEGTLNLLRWFDRSADVPAIMGALAPATTLACAALRDIVPAAYRPLVDQLAAARGTGDVYAFAAQLAAAVHALAPPAVVALLHALEEQLRQASLAARRLLRDELDQIINLAIGSTEEHDSASTALTMTQPTHSDVAKDFDPHEQGRHGHQGAVQQGREVTHGDDVDGDHHRHGGAWLAEIADRLARAASTQILEACRAAEGTGDMSRVDRVVMRWFNHPADPQCLAQWRPRLLQELRTHEDIRRELLRRVGRAPSQQAPNEDQTAGGADRLGH